MLRRASPRQAAPSARVGKERAPGSVAEARPLCLAQGHSEARGKAQPGNPAVFSQCAGRETLLERLDCFCSDDNWQVIRSSMKGTGGAEKKPEVSPRCGFPCRCVAEGGGPRPRPGCARSRLCWGTWGGIPHAPVQVRA